MKLYIKQKAFSIGDKYNVYDVNQNIVFNVKSEIFTIGDKLHLLDTLGNELYYIRRRITFMLARYEIYSKNTLYAVVSQQFTFFKPKLVVESAYGRFDINGNFLSMNFDITKNGSYFGSVHKKWLSWGDSYELDIPHNEDAAFFCALVIAIDNCLHNDNN